MARFAKLPPQFGFAIEYTDSNNNLRYDEPDFVAVTADDPVSGNQVQTFKYSVTVSRAGQSYSVDPEIKNDPNP